MPINPNIAMGVNPIQFKQSDPYDQFGKQLQLKKLLSGEQDDQAARAAISASDGTPKSILAELVKSGNPNPTLYSAYQKMAQEASQHAADADYKKSQTGENNAKIEKAATDQHNAQLQHIQSPADLNGWVQAMYQHPILGPKISKMMPIEQYLSQMPKTPEQFQQWKAEQTMGTGEFLKANKPHFTQEISGDKVTQLQTPGLFGGAPQAMRTTNIAQSPDNKATQETSRANNAATVGASMANASASRDMAQATRDAANITTGFNNEQGLRKEFEGLPEIKSYKKAYAAYSSIKDAAGRNTPQADINLVYGIAKIYDPESVVREGEYATVANSPNIPEKIKGYAQYLAGGGRLSPATKQQIVDEATGRIGSFQAEAGKARKSYEGIAKKRGMSPESVFADMGDFVDGVTPAAPSKPAPVPIPSGWSVRTR